MNKKAIIVVQERQESEAEEQAAKAEQEAKLSAIAEQIAKDGIDVADLVLRFLVKQKQKRKLNVLLVS